MTPLIRSSRFPVRKVCSLSLPRRPAALQQISLSCVRSGTAAFRQNRQYAPLLRFSLRQFHSASPFMENKIPELKQKLTPALLEEVRDFWFAHCSDVNSLILPGQSEMMKWFKKDVEFDKACVTQFQPALEAILASGASASDILNSVDQNNPLAWVSLIILLDQVPRNCYRGNDSKLVFTRFDPLAQEIALRAIQNNVPSQSSQIRYRLAYRFWFHLPLMHSETLAIHEQAVKLHEDTARDMEDLLARDVNTLNADEKVCFDFLSAQRDALQAYLVNGLDFEKRHKVIIERFGRYPHRNQAIGRESTREEIDYLENGGETFG